jgi:DNA repair protein RadA
METSERNEVHDDDDCLFRSAADGFCNERARISTGSKNIDDLLTGGLETGTVTQVYGPPNIGKTHLCHVLCIETAYQTIYIDTEGTFRPQKIQSVAEARRIDGKEVLHNILLARPDNSKDQESFIEKACWSVVKSPGSKIKLLIVDSIMFHYRAEYSGRHSLAKRAQRLNVSMYNLRHLAQTNNIAVMITNQSTSNPENEAKYDNPRPFGGNVISHTSDYIIHLTRGCKMPGSITAILIKSPFKRREYLPLQITEYGFMDETLNFIPKSE